MNRNYFTTGNTELSSTNSTNKGKCHLAYTPKHGLQVDIDYLTHSYKNISINDKLQVTGAYIS